MAAFWDNYEDLTLRSELALWWHVRCHCRENLLCDRRLSSAEQEAHKTHIYLLTKANERTRTRILRRAGYLDLSSFERYEIENFLDR